VLPLFSAILALAAAASATPVSLSADFDGDGRVETATARPLRKAIRVEIADARGTRLASADAAAPAGKLDPASVTLTDGPIGSPGALLAVSSTAGGEQCHSVFRFKDRALTRLPLQQGGRQLPDCAPAEGWTFEWERPAEDAPSVLVRQRTRETPQGPHQEREVYAFTGFALELDLARSSARIGRVVIPTWSPAILYTRDALDILKSRFDLTKFRAAPRLTIETDPGKGVFAFHFKDNAGELVAHVTEAGRGAEKNELLLSIRAGDKMSGVRLLVRDRIVTEVGVSGLGSRWDAMYSPANRLTGAAVETFARAEDEIASDMLPGLWTSEKGEQLAVNQVPGVLGVVEMRKAQLEVLLDPVPRGADVLLLPRDGSAPAWALVLRGGNGIARLPVHCARDGGAWNCDPTGPAELFHRVGGRMNVR
jgi:hypothetical protein